MCERGQFMRRIALRLEEGARELVEPEEIFYVQARGADSIVRLRDRRTRKDVRRLDELERVLAPHGYIRIHRSFLVNLGRIRLLRRRSEGKDWEVVLDPPANKVLPVGRERIEELRRVIDGE